MYVLYTIVASLVAFLILKWMKKRRYCTDLKRLDGKTVLITGGSSGVGKETAVALATRGARVVIACRDPAKAEEAVREIKFRSHSLAVVHMELDLANLCSVREFCKTFLQREKRLDILVNNAAMPGVLDWTDDGFSMCFGVNHLGHFLLTSLLLARLKECAPSRVVTLTCSSYKYQKLNFQDLNYNLLPFFTYCRSKLANVYFSHELGRLTQGKGVTSYAVHPGEAAPSSTADANVSPSSRCFFFFPLLRLCAERMDVSLFHPLPGADAVRHVDVLCALRGGSADRRPLRRVGRRGQTRWRLLCGLQSRRLASFCQGCRRGQEAVGGQRETGQVVLR
ncbi:retinol dehydrogenase 12 isoform X1 [Dunckerocampus dactyliophorus]|uniref:retinol dehydrogenase 12 isoform X1 n=1 Tax=Dunckerocampus dactyliophorus TaxID=161453 RepID=UPI00240666FE|nr:retinol dehydrogenase 12 isoform X1 [Dunckerocampus dactyliophorus]